MKRKLFMTEQIIAELGLSVLVEYQQFQDRANINTCVIDPSFGILSSSSKFSDKNKAWLNFIPDGDDYNAKLSSNAGGIKVYTRYL